MNEKEWRDYQDLCKRRAYLSKQLKTYYPKIKHGTIIQKEYLEIGSLQKELTDILNNEIIPFWDKHFQGVKDNGNPWNKEKGSNEPRNKDPSYQI